MTRARIRVTISLWEIYEKGNELGFYKALLPEEIDGAGLGDLDERT